MKGAGWLSHAAQLVAAQHHRLDTQLAGRDPDDLRTESGFRDGMRVSVEAGMDRWVRQKKAFRFM